MDRRKFLKGVMAGTVAGAFVGLDGVVTPVQASELYIEPMKMKPVDQALIETLEKARTMLDEATLPHDIWSNKLLNEWYEVNYCA